MIRKSVVMIFILITNVISIFIDVYSQEDDVGVVILSEQVGDTIDLEESKKYNLVFHIEGFQYAVFLKFPDGHYEVKITYLVYKMRSSTQKMTFDGSFKTIKISKTSCSRSNPL